MESLRILGFSKLLPMYRAGGGAIFNLGKTCPFLTTLYCRRVHICMAIFFAGVISLQAVDFNKDIRPLLKNKCSRCHSGHEAKGGFSINTRTTLLDAAKPGNSAGSLLYQLITSNNPDERMPSKGAPLNSEEILLIKTWIDAGIKWPGGYNFAEWRRAPLTPRKVALPKGKGNPIDRLLNDYFKERGIRPPKLVDDRTFARRVWLDLVGLLPPIDELERFVSSESLDKRAKLINRLLSDKRAYADHWMSFWNDHLRNAYFGPGFIDNGRAQITTWLYQALYTNIPYDQFVTELIAGKGGAAGFLKGIKWRGAVNASQRREMQAAQNVAQIFMGTNLKCASCHNSFVNYWKLEDAYSLAAIFADKGLELHRCDKPTGKNAKMRFIFPELGSIDTNAPKAQRLKQLAEVMTANQNGRLRRVIVNRLWARLLGRGLIEPLDDVDQPAWNADLLDWLAADFAANGHDLKHTMRLICNSHAYQLPSQENREGKYVFCGPLPKRLQAEQFVDALSTLSGQWQDSRAFQRLDGRKQGGQIGAVNKVLTAHAMKPTPNPAAKFSVKLPDPAWIWDQKESASFAPLETVYLRKTFTVRSVPKTAPTVATCDNEFILYVNGQRARAGKNWATPAIFEITRYLRKGLNVIAVEATNTAAGPAGFIMRTQLGNDWLLTDDTWLVTKEKQNKWNQPGFETRGWKHAANAGPAGRAPWNLASTFNPHNALNNQITDVRAVLSRLDPLQLALGRPNRDQVVTSRSSQPTLLQSLELTNGTTLDKTLKIAAAKWLGSEMNPISMSNSIYRTALSRPPNQDELKIALDLLGENPSQESTADLLWIIVMLPEFQLIR